MDVVQPWWFDGRHENNLQWSSSLEGKKIVSVDEDHCV
jgi:hypothetical protein